jgi:spermidine/putrescine transport system substrate-binding protein
MEDMLVLKGSPMAECEELLNFMLDPATSIAVAEGQNYPPSLDPTKVKLTDKIAKLPAFDPTGTMKSLTFADPIYWAEHEDAWTEAVGQGLQRCVTDLSIRGASRPRSGWGVRRSFS